MLAAAARARRGCWPRRRGGEGAGFRVGSTGGWWRRTSCVERMREFHVHSLLAVNTARQTRAPNTSTHDGFLLPCLVPHTSATCTHACDCAHAPPPTRCRRGARAKPSWLAQRLDGVSVVSNCTHISAMAMAMAQHTPDLPHHPPERSSQAELAGLMPRRCRDHCTGTHATIAPTITGKQLHATIAPTPRPQRDAAGALVPSRVGWPSASTVSIAMAQHTPDLPHHPPKRSGQAGLAGSMPRRCRVDCTCTIVIPRWPALA